MKNRLIGLFMLLNIGLTSGQNTTNCVDILSILVDACAPSNLTEKENEMLRFQVGPNALSIFNMNITFGIGQPFSGIRSPDGFTASKVAFLNSTIVGCGFLKEPVGGILPANAKVLFITSPYFNTSTNSFAGLTDTLYVIFQNSVLSNDAYFINYPVPTNPPRVIPDLQTTTISFGPGCSDVVTYMRSRLVNQAGLPGPQDGASVYFDFNGNASYRNNGCAAPVAPLSANWTSPGTLCDNSAPVNLNNLITGTPGGVFSGQGVSGNQFNPAGLSGQIQITYTVTSNGCQRTQVQNATVIKVQSAEWTAPAQVCAGSSLNLNTLLTGGVTGGTWSGSGVSGSTFNAAGLSGNIAITYRVGSGACQSVVTRNIQVIATANPAWNPPPSICNSAAPINLNTLVTGTAGGTWTGQGVTNGFFDPNGLNGAISIKYEVGNGACAQSSTKNINVLAGPDAPTVSGLLGYCSGQAPEPLTASGETGAVIRWYGNAGLTNLLRTGSSFTPPSNGGSFWIVQERAGCISQPANVSVTINPRPPAPTVPADINYCVGSDPQPIDAVGGAGTFIWYRDAALTDIYFEGNPMIPDFTQNTDVWVIEVRGGCKGPASKISIKTLQGVSISIIPLNGLVICKGESVGLSSSADSGFLWSTGETAKTIYVNNPGKIKLSLSGICNTAADSVEIKKDSVNASFSAEPATGEAPLNVTITPANNVGASNCEWLINGNPVDEPGLNPIEFEQKGAYIISRKCESQFGCIEEFVKTINVSGKSATLYIPNSFSPNEDGINEVFSVKGTGIKQIRIWVFNRWGELLYNWDCLEECGWDGNYLGQRVPTGVYSYKIEALDNNGEKLFRSGKINVIH